MNDPAPSGATTDTSTIAAGTARLGWSLLALWAAVGIGLEAMHGFKLASYLDDTLTRTMLRLGHAHGVLMALVLVLWSHAAAPRLRAARPVARLLATGGVIVPAAFFSSGLHHGETDPGLVVWLVPPAALLFVLGLGATAVGVARRPGRDP